MSGPGLLESLEGLDLLVEGGDPLPRRGEVVPLGVNEVAFLLGHTAQELVDEVLLLGTLLEEAGQDCIHEKGHQSWVGEN